MDIKNFGVIILAAGKGTRMKSDKLKVMHEIDRRPLIDYVMRDVEELKLNNKPVVVVCDDDSAVQDYLGERAQYVVQKERLGTGHAAGMAENVLKDKVKNILVLYGDMPFVSKDFMADFMEKHLSENNVLTLATVTVPSFDGEYQGFYGFGRIVRGVNGDVEKIVERKDASDEELEIKELNTAVFCFKAGWLWENLKKVKNNNAQQEYYLPDLVGLAFSQGEKISTSPIDPREAMGVNTQDELQEAKKNLS